MTKIRKKQVESKRKINNLMIFFVRVKIFLHFAHTKILFLYDTLKFPFSFFRSSHPVVLLKNSCSVKLCKIFRRSSLRKMAPYSEFYWSVFLSLARRSNASLRNSCFPYKFSMIFRSLIMQNIHEQPLLITNPCPVFCSV